MGAVEAVLGWAMLPETVRFCAVVAGLTGSSFPLVSVPDRTRLRVVMAFIFGTSTPESVSVGACRDLLTGA